MNTSMSNYATYEDLSPYFADLRTLPRLSAQEEETLFSRLRLAQQGLLSHEQARAAKQRLVEGCLHRVIRLAKEQQPFFHRHSLSDLIQEGNLGVMQAVEDFDFSDPQGHFFAYVTACIRNALTRLLPRDGLLSIHRLEFWKLAEQGRLKEWDRAQPFSLDVPSEEEASRYEVLPASTARTPVAPAALRQQVELLLARLTPRERTMLRLLYGLDEADGRALSRSGIATHLGIALGAVKGDLWRAFHKLRAAPMDAVQLAEQHRQAAEREAVQQARRAAQEAERQARRAGQEASLEQAYARLEARGLPITMLTLAREAQVSSTLANAYLCRRWGTVAERLERAYVELVQAGAAITVERLAKAARVGERAASDFLHEVRGTTRQARPRHKVV